MAARSRNRKQARLDRLLDIAGALPEIDITGDPHRTFRIRKKNFAYYLDDHHGDGIVALSCKATFEEQADLVEMDPDKFYVPSYVGSKGWVAIRLDLPRVDWPQVEALLMGAYRSSAPKKLVAQLDGDG